MRVPGHLLLTLLLRESQAQRRDSLDRPRPVSHGWRCSTRARRGQLPAHTGVWTPGAAGLRTVCPPLPDTDAAPVDNRKRLTHRCLALPMSKAQGIRGREPALRPGPATPAACFPVSGVPLGCGAPLAPSAGWAVWERGRLRAPSPLLSVDLARERLDCGAEPHHTGLGEAKTVVCLHLPMRKHLQRSARQVKMRGWATPSSASQNAKLSAALLR